MTNARQRRWLWVALALGLAVLLLAAIAAARPGGGHSYSGGSRSSSSSYSGGSRSSGGGGSSSSGDGGALFELLVWLLIQNPSIGIPLLLGVGAFMLVRAAWQRRMQEWTTLRVDVATAPRPAATAPRRELERLRESDPEFSLVLFEDFAYMLYGAVQRARGIGTQWLAPYLSPQLMSWLTDPRLADVQGVVIGALRIERVWDLSSPLQRVELEVEANFVEVSRSGEQQRYYVVEQLVLTRARTAKSRPFARAHKLDCPNCGAPLEAVRGTQCSYCRQDVGLGRFDWMVVELNRRVREAKGPLLTSDSPETGTELPTVIDAHAGPAFEELQRRDPSVSWPAFTTRVAHVFAELQVAWAGREPLRIRPYVSDNLFQSLYYWIDLYLQQRCRNVTEQARILRIDLARVTSDKHYDAITVRLFASSIDYTVADDGELLSGSRSRTRTYSEYWTWIRGSSRRGPGQGSSNVSCPNCGAPLRIGMTGNCEYCRVKVTAGEFDWVLSRIEQDDAYSG
jgi:predicted lipid-binding transport protein (Tim44 family)